jgi:hypothetical protein
VPFTNRKAGDAIYLGSRTLRVIGIRDDDAEQPPVLVVEEVPTGAADRANPPSPTKT